MNTMYEAQQKLDLTLAYALEASIYLSPVEHGLTLNELLEVGQRLGYQRGEINDSMNRLQQAAIGYTSAEPVRWVLRRGHHDFGDFGCPIDDDRRNRQAFQFVVQALLDLTRSEGAGHAKIERASIVARAVEKGLALRDVETAITMLWLVERIDEADGWIRFPHGGHMYPTPDAQFESANQLRQRLTPTARPEFTRAYRVVEDVVGRRTDGRTPNIDPMDAFRSLLETRGENQLAAWWRQTAREVERASAVEYPTSIVTLSAALAEAAVVFLANSVPQMRDGLNAEFRNGITNWKFDAVIRELRKDTWRVFDGNTRSPTGNTADRAIALNATRQRIHAGRLLANPAQFPHPDARPEEATDAKAVAALLTRAVLDWIARNPLPTRS